jgi:hypothetical protein
MRRGKSLYLIAFYATMVLFFSPINNSIAVGQNSPRPEAGKLILFREFTTTAMFAAPSIYVNGQDVGKLSGGTYIEVPLKSGSYEIKSEGNFFNWAGPPRIMRVIIKPGKTSYIQLIVISPTFDRTVVNHRYTERNEVEAEPIVSKLRRN